MSFISFQSAKSRTESRKTSARSKDEELLKLPPINGDNNEENEENGADQREEPKVEELDDYGKLLKAIEGKITGI